MTIVILFLEAVMATVVSKSKFKPKGLEYFRKVEETGQEIIITDHGRPVLKIVPYHPDVEEALKLLRGSVKKYGDPVEPVGVEDWECLK